MRIQVAAIKSKRMQATKTRVHLDMCRCHIRLPRCLRGKESACQSRTCRFNPWVGKISLEEETATHSSILAWKIPWTEELGELPSMGLQRVRCH